MPKQIVADTIEGLKGQVKHTAKAAKRQSFNIVKDILGQKGTGEKGSSAPVPVGQPKQAKKSAPKPTPVGQQAEIDRQERLVKIRRQKQHLEQQEMERKKREQEEVEEELEIRKDDQEEEREKVVQLQKAEEKEKVLRRKRLKGLQGTKEAGPRRKF